MINMQARIREIETQKADNVRGEISIANIDVHDGHSWHYDAIRVIRDDQHEAARISMAICDAIDKLPQAARRRP